MLGELILNNFPQSNVPLIFGYGSRVIQQNGGKSSDLFDIIITVDDSVKWHQENLSFNSPHYSILRFLPDNFNMISKIQENYGAKIYFNPYVRLGDLALKYGVIKTGHLIEDLLNWNNLYVAGRLHKPVDFIVDRTSSNESLKNAIRINRESAVRAALLQLPETFDKIQLYKTIANLSYKGDFRMSFGEDVNKINNIVTAQIERFDKIYLPLLKVHNTFRDNINWQESKQVFSQDLSSKCILKHLRLLPSEVRKSICLIHGDRAKTLELEAVLTSASKSINCDKLVSQALMTIVRRSSLTQSLKGIFTAGLVKSLKYSQRKLFKSITSRLK